MLKIKKFNEDMFSRVLRSCIVVHGSDIVCFFSQHLHLCIYLGTNATWGVNDLSLKSLVPCFGIVNAVTLSISVVVVCLFSCFIFWRLCF